MKYFKYLSPLLLVVILLSTCVPAVNFAEPVKWCGTNGNTIAGYLSQYVPEYFPPSADYSILGINLDPDLALSCSVSTAPLWNACRGHDQCYFTLGIDVSECDDAFLSDLYYACDATYDVQTSLGLACNQACRDVAKVYYEGMLPFSSNAFKNGQAEATEVKKLLEEMLGASSLRDDWDFFKERIALYCATYRDADNVCQMQLVSRQIALEFKSHR